MDTSIISIKGLRKVYQNHVAVNHLDLDIQRGEIFGLLGPNGAGKSTTILMMLGLTEPTTGFVRVNGINPQTHPVEVKKMVGYLPDNIGFYETRTGLDNLVLVAELNGYKYNDAFTRAKNLLETVGLKEVGNQKVSTYSRGMKQRLGLADTLIKNPKIIILDEPTLGLDPSGVKEFLSLIRDLSKKENLTVLLSSHHLHQVQEVCNRVGIFVKGNLIAKGEVKDLAQQLFGTDSMTTLLDTGLNNHDEIESIKNKLQNIRGIDRTEINGHQIVIHHSFNSNTPLVKILAKQEIPIMQILQKGYGLDDIYSYYFEENKS
ncbi:ABC transporter related protein [Pseudopedobacter saltans DSM 12145]|uniref:ABC transporter related protein n=1 Tax=Pseudopedobacter saltans (strain ATCC 51119 / DSM 12145 / JCM 21818 / CCUG 39354 / LMG 10337 / NBRC 100064 / NCIMB 13643) TaxID=762903 RepID=F0SBZ1_PSESL|nr:ABC transporter ATP-binding protein [Pseudopedobacter saltans]ADY53832.1 ABC transporter related protein [Pseudopedobacter saltans DSM 12145]